MLHQCIDIFPAGEQNDTPAKLYTYVISDVTNQKRLRPAVIICPGGGYCFTSDREAEPVALYMTANGISAFVLRYRVAPAEYPAALLDLCESVRYVREHAKEWSIDPDQIFTVGFSAGGHLACCHALFWTEEWLSRRLKTTKELLRPNGCILCYPVITSGEFAHKDSFVNLLGSRDEELVDELSLENKVNDQTPPIFLWHTYTDSFVPVENSLLFLSALRKHSISAEFHMYSIGDHGLSLAREETMNADGGCYQPECAGWIDLAVAWLKRQKSKK